LIERPSGVLTLPEIETVDPVSAISTSSFVGAREDLFSNGETAIEDEPANSVNRIDAAKGFREHIIGLDLNFGNVVEFSNSLRK
jgi:hypothetical protein